MLDVIFNVIKQKPAEISSQRLYYLRSPREKKFPVDDEKWRVYWDVVAVFSSKLRSWI